MLCPLLGTLNQCQALKRNIIFKKNYKLKNAGEENQDGGGLGRGNTNLFPGQNWNYN